VEQTYGKAAGDWLHEKNTRRGKEIDLGFNQYVNLTKKTMSVTR
jgi:hypothetical protein